MIKKIILKKIHISLIVLVILTILYFFPTNKITTVHNNVSLKENIIYLKDINNKISSAKINNYEQTEDEIEYLIKVMTSKNEYNIYLPNYLNPILPEKTKLINYSIESGLLKLNFSKEILNVTKEDEGKLIEALTYTFTELNGINELMIYINNKKLNKLPHSQTNLPSILDRNIGINNIYEITNIKNTTKVTLYYLNNYNNIIYYTPITKTLNTDKDKIEIIISELQSKENETSNLSSYINASVELENYNILENEINLTFNNLIFNQFNKKDISEEARYALIYSIKDSYNCSKVNIIN